MLHGHTPLALAFISTLAACGDFDDLEIQAPSLGDPLSEGLDTEEPGDIEAGGSGGDESAEDDEASDGSTRDLPDRPEVPEVPEHPDHDLAGAVDVVHSVSAREVSLIAVDVGGHPLGIVRLRQDEERRLWGESIYHEGFAWVGLDAQTYDVRFHRATLPVPELEARARTIAKLVRQEPAGPERRCALLVTTAAIRCAEAGASGVSARDECPTSLHRAACACLPSYPLEYVCEG